MLKRLRSTLKKNKKRNLITYTNPESIITEEFRTIRTNIQFTSEEHNCKAILMTSPSTEEGKSTTVANLAVSMAQQKDRVLIIDANLRNPRIHSIFKLNNSIGLSSVLSNKKKFTEAIKETNIGKLEVLSSGPIPDNPAELLGSYEFSRLLDLASQTFDVILIDSPSVLDYSDTKILANQCKSVILVVRNGRSKTEKVMEAKKVLKLAKADLLGAIINQVS
ncbi:CpsD/CapB family tyrosine-protein kinase [Alkalihalobacterium elongatum]|uniref:CpsD/CapB family tyrosine-protein kinase n=1 Tax=Alkalihalobacterium elongatum TaxID=2675466 RepID=UPI001C1F4088|nr:CpsD/CapB family tyrosine-protein kinase [Alkalihalobacterium elongatum]